MQESEKAIIKTYQDLNVYRLSYELAMKIFELTKNFPKEEMYSLTSQIRNSSRSIPANICEDWAKRKYENVFLRHLVDANGSCEETKMWLSFAKDCKYLTFSEAVELTGALNKIGAMLNSLIQKWQTFKV